MNSSVVDKLKGINQKHIILPSVASENHPFIEKEKQDTFEVLSVGRLIPLKGFDLTIKAFRDFLNQLPIEKQSKTKLTIVGTGSHELFYKKMATEAGLAKQITFIPWIQRNELQAIYKKASVFLFPSHEGAGMVVSEALSHGLPVVTLDNYGPGEFINETCDYAIKQTSYDDTVKNLAKSLTSLFQDNKKLYNLSIGAYNAS